MSGRYDYGCAGIIGIGTPQANPTVEAEMRILFDPTVLTQTVRLTSGAEASNDRLRDYLLGLETALERYDTLRPAAFGFACTGSSYLVRANDQALLLDRLQRQFGFPIVTATDAITAELDLAGAKRIALASPYPGTLSDAAADFWREAGFDVATVRRIDTGIADTRGIYTLGSADARPVAQELAKLDVDAVLLSGTGMPSLALLAQAEDGPAIFSSNYCLAAQLCRVAGLPALDRSQWVARLAQATSPKELAP
ncbi:maleate cis-trans isomerase family protein [Stakelama tenebrarum]|uniref:Arylmalonate decarboxylase n=1 Tax=Stakelama tenebrarum TaxID=2711215 RepID=A0A6G6Y2N0_9SPHN|nr:hypothetical protein [Sphingosinithalassobacter tenebrarum]QIG78863.1 hypothetical protein G5C33_03010 [Sphingosinithalassobacter tenebrarum]